MEGRFCLGEGWTDERERGRKRGYVCACLYEMTKILVSWQSGIREDHQASRKNPDYSIFVSNYSNEEDKMGGYLKSENWGNTTNNVFLFFVKASPHIFPNRNRRHQSLNLAPCTKVPETIVSLDKIVQAKSFVRSFGNIS
jgi:hypothetical protein